MTTAKREPRSERNLDGYGAPQIPWASVRARLEGDITQAPDTGGPNRHTFWLTTIQPDGKPHVRPLGVLWVDGRGYFTSGTRTRKAKNLALTPHCALSVALHEFDLIIEGQAQKVTDPAMVLRIAEVYRSQGWPATVTEDGLALTAAYSAPSAGPPPWDIYEVTPDTVYAMGTAQLSGAARWQF